MLRPVRDEDVRNRRRSGWQEVPGRAASTGGTSDSGFCPVSAGWDPPCTTPCHLLCARYRCGKSPACFDDLNCRSAKEARVSGSCYELCKRSPGRRWDRLDCRGDAF